MLSNTLRLNFWRPKIIGILHPRYHLTITGYILENKQMNKHVCIHEIMQLIIMQIKTKMKKDSRKYCINRPKCWHGHNYSKYMKRLSIMRVNFPGAIGLGDNFPWGQISGRNFQGAIFRGDIFPGREDIFPGGIFCRTGILALQYSFRNSKIICSWTIVQKSRCFKKGSYQTNYIQYFFSACFFK